MCVALLNILFMFRVPIRYIYIQKFKLYNYLTKIEIDVVITTLNLYINCIWHDSNFLTFGIESFTLPHIDHKIHQKLCTSTVFLLSALPLHYSNPIKRRMKTFRDIWFAFSIMFSILHVQSFRNVAEVSSSTKKFFSVMKIWNINILYTK